MAGVWQGWDSDLVGLQSIHISLCHKTVGHTPQQNHHSTPDLQSVPHQRAASLLPQTSASSAHWVLSLTSVPTLVCPCHLLLQRVQLSSPLLPEGGAQDDDGFSLTDFGEGGYDKMKAIERNSGLFTIFCFTVHLLNK